MINQTISRRHFLRMSALSGGAALLAACGSAAEPTQAPPAPTNTPEPPLPTDTPAPPPTATPEAPTPEPAAVDPGVEWVSDEVVEFELSSGDWAGPYGRVVMKLHRAVHNGESVYYVRTDSGDAAHAEALNITFVPLLNTAAAMENANVMYSFGDDRPAVIASIPGDENYSSLFRLFESEVSDASIELNSIEEVEAAIADGAVTAPDAPKFVNYPLVVWPGGSLSVDPELEGILPGGQLFSEPDMDAMTVAFKLHQCYPGSRYILTDAAAMAPMMNIAASPPTMQLQQLGGTDEIWVFGNGIPGPGVMGHQPAIFDNKAGEPAWSPFWDHFTLTWNEGVEPRVLTTSAEVREAIEAGDVTEWAGTPDTHPNGFVVNCPVPVRADNDYIA